jgi:hypothetical protein
MNSVSSKQFVNAPLASADYFLQAFLGRHRSSEGASARIVLHAGSMTQSAIVTIGRLHKLGEMTPHYALHWEAGDKSRYPVFDGELGIDGDDTYETLRLVLEGSYTPPGGIAGRAFDAVVGRHIADLTAKTLLKEIGGAIELDYAAAEKAKVG